MSKAVDRQWNNSGHIFSRSEYETMCMEYWKNKRTRVVVDTVQPEQLKKLLEESQKHGLTLNSVITTAFLMAAPEESDAGFAVSVRPDGYEGMGNYASGISIRYRYYRSRDFWSNAAAVHRRIYKKLNSNRAKYFLLNFMNGLEPTLIDAAYFSGFAGFQNETAKKVCKMFGYAGNPKGVSITNLTKAPIPAEYGVFQISGLTFIAPLVPNAKRIIGIVTLGNTMTVSMQFLDGINAQKEQNIFSKAMTQLKLL